MYTPQFSQTATVKVRRLAWALSLSMPKTVDKIINGITAIFLPSAVCPLCKNSTKCKLCEFYQAAAEKMGTENAA
jgi:hypothetical protein